jgi:hypothetical protein
MESIVAGSSFSTSRRSARAGRQARFVTAAAVALTAGMLLALLSGLTGAGTGVGAGAGLRAPGPVPEPAPALSADFPEQANPWHGCAAIVNLSNATGAPRSDRATGITTALLDDACFGA